MPVTGRCEGKHVQETSAPTGIWGSFGLKRLRAPGPVLSWRSLAIHVRATVRSRRRNRLLLLLAAGGFTSCLRRPWWLLFRLCSWSEQLLRHLLRRRTEARSRTAPSSTSCLSASTGCGFAHDDTNVMMLFSNPSFKPNYVNAPVTTMQVAPTILRALGLDPTLLQSGNWKARRFCRPCSSSCLW